MQTRINETVFSFDDTDWVTFYNEHGWVVVENFLHDSLRNDSLTQWNELKNDCAIEMGMSLDEYQLEVSQWRDLWTNGGTFHQLIFEPIFHSLAQIGMGWNGSRLLHDHIICKPHQGSNKKIPWHQDSMFWPVDTHGCSTWTALRDVTISDGCLEVIDRSHLEGCENPVDFMAKERESFPEGSIRVQLPIRAGSTILLHSLTWHRSAPNTGQHDRPAHLALWVHPDAKWRPDLVDWHPINEHVEAEPGMRLEGKKFPHFGTIDLLELPVDNIHSGTIRDQGISMFDASKIVGNQLSKISGFSGGITEILSDKKAISKIVKSTIENEIYTDEEAIRTSLDRLRVSYLAYELHRARNVYNDAYAYWWEIAGEAWNDILEE